MKIKGIIVITGVVALLFGSCTTRSIKKSKLVTENDTLSYALGVNYYSRVSRDSIFLNPVVFAKSFMDAKAGKLVMNEAEIQSFLTQYSDKMQEVMMKRQKEAMKQKDELMKKQAETNKITFKNNITRGDSFLQKNKERKSVFVTPSGLQYEVIKMGKGPKPTIANTVNVHYVGTLIDGTEFESSYKKNEPAQFSLTGVIPGWKEALQLMPVGSKFKLFIPESIAYGAYGRGKLIQPYSTLIFEIELLEIVK